MTWRFDSRSVPPDTRCRECPDRAIAILSDEHQSVMPVCQQHLGEWYANWWGHAAATPSKEESE